jgi:hypothetical protein
MFLVMPIAVRLPVALSLAVIGERHRRPDTQSKSQR